VSFVKVCGSSLAAAAAAGMPGLGRAQDKMVWKASDVHPLGYPTVEAIQRMGKKLEARRTAASRSRCTRRCSSAARRR
jgi:TRAP-type C4-dicarboxylate transport system substrate-binding protein